MTKKKELRHPLFVRLFHLAFAPAIVLSFLTGLYMTRPRPVPGLNNMQRAKLLHSSAGFVVASALAARFYYAFAGHPVSNYSTILPTPGVMRQSWDFIRYELFATAQKPQFPKYNPGQKVVLSFWTGFIPLQGMLGLALFSPDRFQHLTRAIGGLGRVRLLHYFGSVVIGSTVAVHVYLALTSSVDKLKSIFTGYTAKKS